MIETSPTCILKKGLNLLTVVLVFFTIVLGLDSIVFAAQYAIEMQKPVASLDKVYVDSDIAIQFKFSENASSRIGLAVKNRTDEVIKIDWNQVIFVAPDGRTFRTSHMGIGYADVNQGKPMVPSIIPPNARLDDAILLPELMSFHGGVYGSGWVEGYIFPQLYKDAVAYQGNTFNIFLPVEIKGNIKYYNFTFLISAVTQQYPEHSYLGVGSVDRNSYIIYQNGNPPEKGIYIVDVGRKTPADKAGLQSGDIIIRFGDIGIDDYRQFIHALQLYKPEQKVVLHIIRNGQILQKEVELAKRKPM